MDTRIDLWAFSDDDLREMIEGYFATRGWNAFDYERMGVCPQCLRATHDGECEPL